MAGALNRVIKAILIAVFFCLSVVICNFLSSAHTNKSLVFVDADIQHRAQLISEINSLTQNSADIIILDKNKNGLQQIADRLESENRVSAIHIISHGRSGVLDLGKDHIDFADLDLQETESLTQIGKSLRPGADLLFYGCDFGHGSNGQNALTLLSKITGVDIAASIDRTGHKQNDGNWDLEARLGDIQTPSLHLSKWPDFLAATLQVDKSASPNPVIQNGASTFTITVTNTAKGGPSNNATNVNMTDILPASMNYLSHTTSQGSCSVPSVGTNGTVSCALGTINRGNNFATVTIEVEPTIAGVYNNTADAAADGGVNASGSTNLTVIDPAAAADLELNLTSNNSYPGIGSNVIFSVQVLNQGAALADGISVSVLLPSGFSYVTDSSGGDYNSGTGVWTIPGLIAAAGSASIDITATVLATGSYLLDSQILSSNQFDPDSVPNNGLNNPLEDDEQSIYLSPTSPGNQTPSACPSGNGVYADFTFTGASSGMGVFTTPGPEPASLPDFTWSITGDDGNSAVSTAEIFNGTNSFEPIFGEADNESNLDLEVAAYTANPGDPIPNRQTLTITFNSLSPAGNVWGFALTDVEVDQILIRARDSGGSAVPFSTIDSWFVQGFDADPLTDSIEIPQWDGTNAVLVGSASNTSTYDGLVQPSIPGSEAAAAWFSPDTQLTELILHYEALESATAPNYHVYIASCIDPPAQAELTASKTVEIYDPSAAGLYAIPSNDVIYTISVTNTGDGNADTDSIVIIDPIPADLTFYNDDIDDAGPETDPVAFSQQNGAGLTFNFATDVRFSNSGSPPASFAACAYVPSTGYDANVSYLCVNPKGAMNFGNPDPSFEIKFRGQIK